MLNRTLRDRYINPYTDFGFKILFGTEMNKELLISFVNSLFKGKEVITDLTYLNTEHLGTSEYDRRAVFDVYCENEKGEKILIEMQRGEQQFFKDRSLYYATFPIREQGEKGEWNYRLKAVYVIGILNFTFDHQDEGYFHHEVQLMDTQTKTVFYDKLTFIYLEMPKFNKTENELDGMFEKWLFVLRNLSRLMERPLALQDRIFNKLFETAEISKFTKEQYDAYEESRGKSESLPGLAEHHRDRRTQGHRKRQNFRKRRRTQTRKRRRAQTRPDRRKEKDSKSFERYGDVH